VLSTGNDSVVQTTQAVDPGRAETRFFETSSIFTTARPVSSWPVTTRRNRSAILFFSVQPACITALVWCLRTSLKNFWSFARHTGEAGIQKSFEIPGFRVALAIASLPGMTFELCCKISDTGL